jgi:hypothetical protein
MKFVIRPNRHHAFPPPLGIFFKRRSFSKAVIFHASCAADVEGIDYFDVSKLFGFGYFKGGHHRDSARFGWRYNAVHKVVELYAYCYVDGERTVRHLQDVPLEQEVYLNLYVSPRAYYFTVKAPHSPRSSTQVFIPLTHKKKWRYALGFYFGGNKTPKQKVEATIRNLKNCTL